MTNTNTAMANVYHERCRVASMGSDVDVLTDIYNENTNIVIWHRQVNPGVKNEVKRLLASGVNINKTIESDTISTRIPLCFDSPMDYPHLVNHIVELTEMFSCLFDLQRVGLRLKTLDKAMCPRFHVDRVPCRLVSTLHGAGTEWLEHSVVDRAKLGHGSGGLRDEESGLFNGEQSINQINTWDVALLKGELWHNNENAGLVHRSPCVGEGERRLLLTLDFAI